MCNRLCRDTATRGHRWRGVPPCNQLAHPLETQSKVNVPSVIRYLSANGVTPVDNHRQLMDALKSTRYVTERGVDTVQCNSDATHAEDWLSPPYPHKFTMNDNTRRTDTLIKKGRRITPTDTLLGGAGSTGHEQKCVHSGSQVRGASRK